MDTVTITRNGATVFESEISGWSDAQRVGIQLKGGYVALMPLEIGKIYNIAIAIEGLDNIELLGIFEGYFYNASTMLVDGVQRIGVTQNLLQFAKIE